MNFAPPQSFFKVYCHPYPREQSDPLPKGSGNFLSAAMTLGSYGHVIKKSRINPNSKVMMKIITWYSNSRHIEEQTGLKSC
jgi:hypothetical protein